MEAIYTWIDLNGVYYPFYESAYPDNPAGRSPLTFAELERLGELTGINFDNQAGHTRTSGPQIAFERPALSPCLKKIQINSASYVEALEIIKKGQQRLVKIPRADMEGFEPCKEQKDQIKKYMNRLLVEKENNKAITGGRLIFDK